MEDFLKDEKLEVYNNFLENGKRIRKVSVIYSSLIQIRRKQN